MVKKTLLIIGVISLLVMANFAVAADKNFNDANGTHLWTDNGNWLEGTAAVAGDYAYFNEDFNSTGNYCLIQAGDNITCARLRMSSVDTGKNVYIRMDGGTLNVTSGIDLGYYHFYDPCFTACTFEQNGGEVICGDFWRIAYRTGVSRWLLKGGTVFCGRFLYQASWPDLYSKVEIAAGSFSVKYNRVSTMEGLFGTTLLPYNGVGTLVAEYDPTLPSPGTTILGRTTVYNSAYVVEASVPVPDDQATEIPLSTELSWNPGVGSSLHDVYLGTDFNDVNDASDPNTAPGKGRSASASYSASGLDFDTTYYWRVDEVNDGGVVARGDVWSFTTGSFIEVDNFEDYNNIDSTTGLPYDLWERYPAPAGTVWATWTDGYDDGLSGSVIYDAEGQTNGGEGAIKLAYDNDGAVSVPGYSGTWDWTCPYYSEIVRTSPITDMTASGVKAISVTFKGAEDNDGQPMYMALSDGTNMAVVTNDDPNVTIGYQWESWNIALSEFTAANPSLDLTNITKIYVGFGNRLSPVSGGSGTVYIDDIRLYLPRCVSGKVVGDLANGDCTVTLDDVSTFVQQWLQSDVGTVTAAAPDDSKLVAYYDFDETSGTVAADSSASGADANILLGTPVWDAAGKNGGCLNFDGTFVVDVPVSVFADVNEQITISLWVNGDINYDINTRQFAFHAISEDDYFDLLVDNKGGGHVLALNIPYSNNIGINFEAGVDQSDATHWDTAWYHGADSSAFRGRWNHYAMTKNVGDATIKIYCNGILVGEDDSAELKMNSIGQFMIGFFSYYMPGNSSFKIDPLRYPYHGKIDDFKVYKYALTQSEILSLAGLSSVYQPVLGGGDLNGDGSIDFKDYATLVENWLVEQVWP